MKFHVLKKIRGFTLIELIVTIAIFAMMTALMVYKYGNFNNGIALTNTAYDMAIILRSAQSYGLNVKSAPGVSLPYSNNFNTPYGVFFQTISGPGGTFYNDISLFADINTNGVYDSGVDTVVSHYTFKNGFSTYGNCLSKGSDCVAPTVYCTSDSGGRVGATGGITAQSCASTGVAPCTSSYSANSFSITFKRPDPTAIIRDVCGVTYSYAEIYIATANGSEVRRIVFRDTGQVSVQNL